MDSQAGQGAVALGQGEAGESWGRQQGSWSRPGRSLGHGEHPVLVLQHLPRADIADKQKQACGETTEHGLGRNFPFCGVERDQLAWRLGKKKEVDWCVLSLGPRKQVFAYNLEG